ncbi:MAG TPA: hypothetical protein VFV02_17400 [Acidimicrobiales bacterium]|nr:hypothetical protein [Acidimicrobiales bacterium]
MQVDAILCNHAEAVNNQLYISGGGIELAQAPAGATPPLAVTLGVGMVLTVGWSQTNEPHQVEIELLTEDGVPVDVPTGPGIYQPFKVQMSFNVGRPPVLAVGDDQHVCLAANFPGLPLPVYGKYEFIVRVDGNVERTLPYRVVAGAAPGTGSA